MDASKAAVDTDIVRQRLDLAVWGVPLAATAGVLAVLVVVFFDTFRSIVAIWSRSETFAHGYLIVPISLYVMWDERDRLRGVVPQPSYRALFALAVAGLGWLCSRVAGVQVLEQYSAVAMIPVAVWAVLGTAVARRLAFPLGFLLLGVPVGEFLIPPLIDFTAAFTVAGLRLSGVPVLQEANFLTLANSHWSVVEACSGLRYLIACFTLGVLYAHMTYRSWWRRGLCLVAAIIVPIIANGFRAYMIVMLGYLSDMTLAVGVDHLIYGWVFFGVVIALFFWVGSFFREDTAPTRGDEPVEPPPPPSPAKAFVLAAGAVVLLASVWPVWARVTEGDGVALADGSALPARVEGWVSSSRALPWSPHFVGADRISERAYERGSEWVGVHLACYAVQAQGAELVSSSNVLVDGESAWRQMAAAVRPVALASGSLDVVEVELDAHGPKLRVWQWYWIGGTPTVSPYRAKLIELAGKLAGRPPTACAVSVFTPDSPELNDAAARLTGFVDAALPSIDQGLTALRAN